MSVLRTYGKSLIAVLFAALRVAAAALTDGRVTGVERIQIAIAAVVAIQVWLVPNLADWPGAKTATAVVLSALGAAVPLLAGGAWTGADWIAVVLATGTVLGVAAAPAPVAKAVAARPVARPRR